MKKSLWAMLILAAAGVAHAETPWSVKLGVSEVITQGDGGTLAGVYQGSTSNNLQFTPSIEYAFNHNISAELLLATPFKHSVYLDGVKAATVKQLPPTLSLKYTFPQYDGLKPYFGLGINYTRFWDAKTQGPLAGSKVSAGSSIGMAGLVGVAYAIPNTPFDVALDVRYVNLDSKIKLNGNKIGDLTINPWVVGVGATYHF